MKNLILIFLFILSVPVLSAETAAASSSENGFIVTSNQFKDYVQTTIFDTKKKSLEIIITDVHTGLIHERRTYSSK